VNPLIPQGRLNRHHHVIRQHTQEDVGLHAVFQVMEDRTLRQRRLERPEGALRSRSRHIHLPRLLKQAGSHRRMFWGHGLAVQLREDGPRTRRAYDLFGRNNALPGAITGFDGYDLDGRDLPGRAPRVGHATE
jgi:hypothetical protein